MVVKSNCTPLGAWECRLQWLLIGIKFPRIYCYFKRTAVRSIKFLRRTLDSFNKHIPVCFNVLTFKWDWRSRTNNNGSSNNNNGWHLLTLWLYLHTGTRLCVPQVESNGNEGLHNSAHNFFKGLRWRSWERDWLWHTCPDSLGLYFFFYHQWI